MSAPIKLKPLNCERVTFNAVLDKDEVNLPKLYSALAPALKRRKSPPSRLPLFVPIDTANPESDCHLHLTLEKSEASESLLLALELVTLQNPAPAKPDFPITVETVGTWLGGSVKEKLSGAGYGSFSYAGPSFRPVIPLPYSGVLPIESSVIRKSSIAGLDVEVGESDIGLRRFFMYKPKEDIIILSIIFAFSHPVNYALFAKLVETAAAISSVLVIKEKQDASVVG